MWLSKGKFAEVKITGVTYSCSTCCCFMIDRLSIHTSDEPTVFRRHNLEDIPGNRIENCFSNLNLFLVFEVFLATNYHRQSKWSLATIYELKKGKFPQGNISDVPGLIGLQMTFSLSGPPLIQKSSPNQNLGTPSVGWQNGHPWNPLRPIEG